MTKHSIYTMSVAKAYPLYVKKAERKGEDENRGGRDHALVDGI